MPGRAHAPGLRPAPRPGLRTVLVLLLTVALATTLGCRPDRPARRTAQPVGCLASVIDDEPTAGCRGVRVRFPNPKFVPQGLAVAGDGTAYVSGYDYEPHPGHRECQVAHVDLRTGTVLAFADFFQGRVPAEFCRHGGGIALSSHGLWLAGAGRIWLHDPDLLGTGEEVRRLWVVDHSIRASTVAADEDALVIGWFSEHRRGWVLRFRYADLLAPGALTMDAQPGGGGVEPVRVRRVPSHVQGLTVSGGRTWLARSTSYCGELVTPGGRRIPFLPGAEGVGFDRDGRLWAVSESGSRPYQRMGGRPDVPTLSRVDLSRLDRSVVADCW